MEAKKGIFLVKRVGYASHDEFKSAVYIGDDIEKVRQDFLDNDYDVNVIRIGDFIDGSIDWKDQHCGSVVIEHGYIL